MSAQQQLVTDLFNIRNQYGGQFATQKLALLHSIGQQQLTNAAVIKQYYEVLLFMMAFPDNKEVHRIASAQLQQLEEYIKGHAPVQAKLLYTGITGSDAYGAWSYEVVKWLRETYGKLVTMDVVLADEGQISSILSALMPKVESEVLQDYNSTWRVWIKKIGKPEDDMLDHFLAIFAQSDARPEIKDELWTALNMHIVVRLAEHTTLPDEMRSMFYHRNMERHAGNTWLKETPEKAKITEEQAQKIIECGRMILVRHQKEIDPVTFSSASFVSYYHASRGISIALMGMRDERRHPVDSYMGYVAFKNGLPVAYGGSWILFDSGRIALNIFPAYRGGESLYIVEQILKVHRHAYRLKRFSVDPYQIGKHNSDGIKSGAFWVYHKVGFHAVKEHQREIIAQEAEKLQTIKGYRSPVAVLAKIADTKLELEMAPGAACFDAADLSFVYAAIVKRDYNNDRLAAEQYALPELIKILKPGNLQWHPAYRFVIKNWCVLLATRAKELRAEKALRDTIAKCLELKAFGDEEAYIRELQKSVAFKKLLAGIVAEYTG